MRFLSQLSIILAIFAIAYAQDGLVNKNVNRNIDLTSQFAKHTSVITLQNNGAKPATSFVVAIDSKQNDHLSILSATDESGAKLTVSTGSKAEGNGKAGKIGYTAYTITLAKPLAAGASTDIKVKEVYTHVQTPYPAAIRQNEKQLVRYTDNVFFFSPYATTSQTTTVKLASSNVESKTDISPSDRKGDTITYGPYADTPAFSREEFSVHYENNKPFLTVAQVVKEYEISHWGNLAVEETYTLMSHDGAELKGTFSRYDFQRNPTAASAVITSVKTTLPASAADVYYRDDIGNITTSSMSSSSKGVVLDVVPRFPLFGGWKTSFYMGYNLPLYQYLFNDARDGSVYVLNATFGTGFEDIVIDELVVRIILPEGAKDYEFHVPFPVDSNTVAYHWTYLDTSGRPVIVITKKNVVSEHNQNFQVVYRFSSTSLFHEPLILVLSYLAFFVAVMVYVRLNFHIGPVKQRPVLSAQAEDVLVRVRDVFDRRTAIHDGLTDSLSKLSTGRANYAQYSTTRKQAETNLATLKREAQAVISEMEKVNGDLSRQLIDLEDKQEKRRVRQIQLHDNEVGYRVDNKISKGDFEANRAVHERTFLSLNREIDDVVYDLTDGL